MSPKLGAITAAKPESRRAQVACSREDPHPKLAPATSTEAPATAGRFSSKSGAWRQSKNRNGPYPVRSILFRNCLGMIWSVSTSARSRGAIRPETRLTGSMSGLHELPHIDEVTGYRRRRGHRRAHQVGSTARSLPPPEVPVGGGGAALPGREDVRVHAEAHRAARAAPLEAGGLEHQIEPFVLRRSLYGRRSRHHQRTHLWMHTPSLDDTRGRPQVLQPCVGARADEDAIDSDARDR